VLVENANILQKKICAKPVQQFKKWSYIRKGLCRKRFLCQKNATGKVKCKFTGKVICKKVPKVIKQKTKCFFKQIKKSLAKLNPNKDCKQRICCTGNKCKEILSKPLCIPKKRIANGCKWQFLGKGRCRRKYCCTNGKCEFKGKKLCKIIPDKKNTTIKKK